jgi:hypothetical protein
MEKLDMFLSLTFVTLVCLTGLAIFKTLTGRIFAEYAEAFARRYPHLQYYTPVNEIFITAMFSGQYGWWNECGTSDRTFVLL